MTEAIWHAHMHSFVSVARTKFHILDVFVKNGNLFSYSSGGYKLLNKVSSHIFAPWLEQRSKMAIFYLCLHVVFCASLYPNFFFLQGHQ